MPIRVVVVDNGSRDGTPAAVRERFPWVEVLEERENTGFARATNRAAAGGSAEHLLVLNPDTVVGPGVLDVLLDVLGAQSQVAVVGPKLVREDGSFDHASRRSFPTIVGALGHFTRLGRRLSRGPLAQYRAPEVERGPVDAVNGAFMLLRRDDFEACGGFDERYWMYMEDLDLSYRLRDKGRLSWYEPSVEVLHVKGASAGIVRSARLEIAFHTGMWRFYRDHYAPARPRLVSAAVAVGIGFRLAGLLVTAPLRRAAARIAA